MYGDWQVGAYTAEVLLHAQAALDLAVDVFADGAAVSPDLPAGASRPR
jgi:hypothetical protein